MKAPGFSFTLLCYALLVLVLFAPGCNPRTPPVSVPENEYRLNVVWRVIDSPRELAEIYSTGGGTIIDYGSRATRKDRLYGFSARGEDGTIYVYTLRPEHVDDSRTLTLGHEVMHVALGDYHPEK